MSKKYESIKQYEYTPDDCDEHQWVRSDFPEGLYSEKIKIEKRITCEKCGLVREFITMKVENPRTQGVIK